MDQAANKTPPTHSVLTLGLDIGIASVGWAVLSETRIVDIGVRCFDKAETAKEGESLNLARRQARLLRRRLYRRSWRLTKLRFSNGNRPLRYRPGNCAPRGWIACFQRKSGPV
jgi:CRISPR/Cas system Type II protein with McrA/HNH and RuvC-like nuclease domain